MFCKLIREQMFILKDELNYLIMIMHNELRAKGRNENF